MRTVDTTPTIVRHGPGCVPLRSVVRKRAPSALRPRKCLAANAALTIATGSRESRSSTGERASVEYRLAHDVEEAAGDLLEVGVQAVASVDVRASVDFDRTGSRKHHPEPVGERHRGVLGVGAQPLDQAFVEQLRALRAPDSPPPSVPCGPRATRPCRSHSRCSAGLTIDRICSIAPIRRTHVTTIWNTTRPRDQDTAAPLVSPRPLSRSTSTALVRDDIDRRQQVPRPGRPPADRGHGEASTTVRRCRTTI